MYLLVPPSDIVGSYNDPLWGFWEWEFNDSGTGTARRKLRGPNPGEFVETTIRFNYKYSHCFPTVTSGLVGFEGIATHTLEITDSAAENGTVPDELKTEPGAPKRFVVWERDGFLMFDDVERIHVKELSISVPVSSWKLKRR
jgi:hypothetical protein